jgi:hypothetical protein
MAEHGTVVPLEQKFAGQINGEGPVFRGKTVAQWEEHFRIEYDVGAVAREEVGPTEIRQVVAKLTSLYLQSYSLYRQASSMYKSAKRKLEVRIAERAAELYQDPTQKRGNRQPSMEYCRSMAERELLALGDLVEECNAVAAYFHEMAKALDNAIDAFRTISVSNSHELKLLTNL